MSDIPKVWMASEWSPEIVAPLKENAEIVSGEEKLGRARLWPNWSSRSRDLWSWSQDERGRLRPVRGH